MYGNRVKLIATLLVIFWPGLLLHSQVIQPGIIPTFAGGGGGGGSLAVVGAAVDSELGTVSLGELTINYTPVSAGNSMWYFPACYGGVTTLSLTDSTGSPTTVTSPVSWYPSNLGVYGVYFLAGISGAPHTVIFSIPGANYCTLTVLEVAGNSSVGNTVASSIGSSNTTSIPCDSLTTSAGSIILSFSLVGDGSQTYSAGAGPPSWTFLSATSSPALVGTPLSFSGVEFSTSLTTATTYPITNGFATTATAAPYFCWAGEAKP